MLVTGREFTTYSKTLEQEDVIKYLGRLLTMDDNNDMQVVRHNLRKARGV